MEDWEGRPLSLRADTLAVRTVTRMFASLIDDELSELSYDAELAGLRYSVSNSQSGFLVRVCVREGERETGRGRGRDGDGGSYRGIIPPDAPSKCPPRYACLRGQMHHSAPTPQPSGLHSHSLPCLTLSQVSVSGYSHKLLVLFPLPHRCQSAATHTSCWYSWRRCCAASHTSR